MQTPSCVFIKEYFMRRYQKMIACILSATMLLPGVAAAAPGEAAAEKALSDETFVTLLDANSSPEEERLVSKRLAAEKTERKDTPELLQAKANLTDFAAKTEAPKLPEVPYAEGRLLVKLEHRPFLMDGEDLFAGIAAEVDHLFTVTEPAPPDSMTLAGELQPDASWYRVELAEGVDMLSAWRQLLAEDAVLCVEPDYQVKAQSLQDITAYDPWIYAQTWLEQINAYGAWEQVSRPGQGVVVAVIDSGVDLDHPDLQENLLPGYDFVDYDAMPEDEDGHGTHVAGIIAAAKNREGVRGVAWDAEILPIRALDKEGSGYGSDIFSSICWAAGQEIEGAGTVSRKADIINLSLGGFGESEMEQDAVAFARQQGCLVVASAGNDGLPNDYAGDSYWGGSKSPGNIPGVLTVMAMNPEPNANGDWLADFSNYDPYPGMWEEYEIMAPGVDIFSTEMDGDYVYMQGTSMACPVVAGAAAVLMGMGCTAEEAWELLVFTGQELQGKTQPDGRVQHYPALDLHAAVEAKLNGGVSAEPLLGNMYFETSLESLDFGSGPVDFSGLNTTSRLYYYNGNLCSSVFVAYENFGGAGTVTLTGTVNDREIAPIRIETVAGETNRVKVPIPATTVSDNGRVHIQLFADGELVCGDVLLAAELKTPAMSGLFTVSGDYYVPVSDYVRLGGRPDMDVVWVLDRSMRIPENYWVEIGNYDAGSHNVVVYQDSGEYIWNMYNSTTEACGSVEFYWATLLAAETFHVLDLGDTYLYCCSVYAPYIEWVAEASQNFFMDAGWMSSLRGWKMYSSSFIDLWGLELEFDIFERNLVNHCAYSRLIVLDRAVDNTFVENYMGADSESVMTSYAKDASISDWQGFLYNNIVGPMNLGWLNGKDQISEYPAKVSYIYHQKADDPSLWFEDTLWYDAGSLVSSDPQVFADWNHGALTPVFVMDTEVEYALNPDHEAVDFTITFYLSTAIDEGCWPWLESDTDPLVSTADISVSKYRTMVTARTCVPMEEMDMVLDYQLCGIYNAPYENGTSTDYFWSTELAGQTCTAESHFESMRLQDFYTAGTENGVALYWNDDRIQSGDRAVILRCVDDGSIEELAYVDALDGVYEDTSIEGGHVYWYEVNIVRNEIFGYYDSTEFVYSLWTPHGGEDLTTTVDAVTSAVEVGLNSPCLAGGSQILQYTLPETMAAQIEFAPQVRGSGLRHGAVHNGDGTVTVTIGAANESAALQTGTLFSLIPAEGVTCRKLGEDVYCMGKGLQLWHLGQETALLAGYRDGQLMGAGVAAGWNRSCGVSDGDSWKLFLTDENWNPVQTAQDIF